MLTVFDIDGVEMQRNIEKKCWKSLRHNIYIYICGSIEIRDVDIAGVGCNLYLNNKNGKVVFV